MLDHFGEIALRAFDGKAAEAVVAAELKHDDLRFVGEDAIDALETIFGGVAADAFVDDAVAKTGGVEEMLEISGVAGGGFDAVAGGETVAEAGDDGTLVGDVDCGLRACGMGSGSVLGGGARWRGADGKREESGEDEN
jgi:hypothetical protein